MSSPSLNLRLRADAAYLRHEGRRDTAQLEEEGADEIDRLKEAKRKFSLLCDEKGAENVKLRTENERLRAALKPFAVFAEKAEAFVAARAKDGGSPILPSKDFRLADFKRASDALGDLEQ